jgi:hypothetical protein
MTVDLQPARELPANRAWVKRCTPPQETHSKSSVAIGHDIDIPKYSWRIRDGEGHLEIPPIEFAASTSAAIVALRKTRKHG